jgi:hypothetical protein
LTGHRNCRSTVDGNPVQPTLIGRPQSSERCPACVGILSAMPRIPHARPRRWRRGKAIERPTRCGSAAMRKPDCGAKVRRPVPYRRLDAGREGSRRRAGPDQSIRGAPINDACNELHLSINGGELPDEMTAASRLHLFARPYCRCEGHRTRPSGFGYREVTIAPNLGPAVGASRGWPSSHPASQRRAVYPMPDAHGLAPAAALLLGVGSKAGMRGSLPPARLTD